MPCITPYRDDAAQLLLFKIASCLAAGGGGGGTAGVLSFNSRTGVVTLTSGDVTGALGFTPAASGSGVTSFNTRTGAVTLTSADVTTALGFTPLNTTTGDARYVLKTGDTMTGALAIGNGVLVADTPYLNLSQTWNNGAVTFTGLQSNITNTASSTNSNLFNFQVDGVDRFNFTPGGSLRAVRQDASDSGMNLFLRKRGNAGGATNAVAADSTVGTVAFSSWDGTGFFTGSRVSGLASEAWTNIAHGSRIDLYTTPLGSTAEQIALRLSHTGQSQFLDGTAALPALTFQSDPDTGIYRIGANSLGFSAGGVLRLTVDGTSTTSAGTFLIPDGTVALPGLAFSADTNTGIYRIGADNFGLSAGGALSMSVSTAGVNVTAGLAYRYNSANVIRAQTALGNYFFGPSGNLTMTGTNNVSVGDTSLQANTSGNSNIAIGSGVLGSNTTGSDNFALGTFSLSSNLSGNNNSAVGTNSLAGNTTGSNNVGIGRFALLDSVSGSQNTAIGYNTGRGITTGGNNTIIGAQVTGLAAGLTSNIILADGTGAIRLQIDSSGNTTLAGTVATAAGTAALPAHTFSADLDTGMYRIGANSIGFSVNGVLAFTIDGTSVTPVGTLLIPDGTEALPGLAFAADTNTGIYRIGADILGFSTAGTARWQISASGHLLATTDNLFDIGASGATRPRSLYVSANGTFGSTLSCGSTFTSGGSVSAGSANFLGWTSRSYMDSPSDGVIKMGNSAGTDFGRLQFGGTTSSFPSIKRSTTTLQFRLADDSAFAGIATAGIVMSLAAPLSFTSGANTRAGNAVLVAGTVTVANTSVTANTIVIVTRKTSGGTIGFAVTYTVIAATSFTLTSDSALDTSTYSYILIENP